MQFMAYRQANEFIHLGDIQKEKKGRKIKNEYLKKQWLKTS